MPESGENVRLLTHVAVSLLPVENGKTIRADEVRRINHAQLAIDVREDHVEVDCRRFLRHHYDDEVRHLGLLEQERRETVDTGGARTLAEPDEQNIFAQWMNIAAFEGVVEPPLHRPGVDNSTVCPAPVQAGGGL